MSNFEFVSHEEYPEDEYTKEVVYLCFDGKYRVGYFRKKLQNGGLFWAVPGTSVKKNGSKNNLKAFVVDSNFLNEDVMHFLESRSWENKVNVYQKPENQDGIPF